MTIEQKAAAYDEAIERAKDFMNGEVHYELKIGENIMCWVFPELRESEDERIRKEIMDFIDTKTIGSDERRNRWFSYLEKSKPISFTSLEDTKVKMSLMQYISELNQDVVHLHPGIETCNEWIAWLEKQCDTNETINRDKFAQGVLRGAALNLITWIDYNTAEGNMCLSNMECKDIEDALVSGDWDKIYTYIKKKLEKQSDQKETLCDKCKKAQPSHSCQDITALGRCALEEMQGEQPRYSIGDVLCDKSCTTLDKNAQPNFEVTDIRDGMYICDKCSFPISQQDEYELVAKKIEPKFKVGDWVVYECGEETATLQITRIVGETYVFSDDSTLGVVDEDTLRLWDITKDAKDGKVLYTKGGIGHEKKDIVFIFKGIGSRNYLEEPCIEHYCYLCEDRFYVNTTGFMGVLSDNIKQGTCPATKEQRDLLFQKMHEAGYEWDSEKKELKKIDQNPAKGTKGNEREIPFSEQKWSEEDESMWAEIADLLWEGYKQSGSKYSWDNIRNWVNPKLKSLRPQKQWKPSEEQIASITCAVRKMKESACYDSELVSLFNDLKKLKG